MEIGSFTPLIQQQSLPIVSKMVTITLTAQVALAIIASVAIAFAFYCIKSIINKHKIALNSKNIILDNNRGSSPILPCFQALNRATVATARRIEATGFCLYKTAKKAFLPYTKRYYPIGIEYVVKGDGACLYHSLLLGLKQLKIKTPETVMEIKGAIASFFCEKILNDPTLFNLTFQETLDRLSVLDSESPLLKAMESCIGNPRSLSEGYKKQLIADQKKALLEYGTFGGNVAIYCTAKLYDINIFLWYVEKIYKRDSKENNKILSSTRDLTKSPLKPTVEEAKTRTGLTFNKHLPTLNLIHEGIHYNLFLPKMN